DPPERRRGAPRASAVTRHLGWPVVFPRTKGEGAQARADRARLHPLPAVDSAGALRGAEEERHGRLAALDGHRGGGSGGSADAGAAPAQQLAPTPSQASASSSCSL